jgi:hypothetical protein
MVSTNICDHPKTETRDNNQAMEPQKEYLKKNTIGKNIHYGVMDISHLLLSQLAKKQLKIAYRTIEDCII